MAGPWENYAPAQESGPWEQYSAPTKQSFPWGEVLGETTIGKAVKGLFGGVESTAKLAGDVYSGRTDPMSDEGIERTFGAAALSSPVSAATRAGQAVMGGRNFVPQASKVPTAPELKSVSGGQYNAARELDVTYAAPAVKQWADTVDAGLQAKIIPERAPETYAILGRLQNPGEARYATYDGLQSARDQLQEIARKGGPDGEAARRVRDALDGFIEGTHAPGAVAGPAAEAAALTKAGRGNRAAAERANDITGALDRARTGILERAEGRAAAANSGRNFDNAARSRLESALERPREVQGWSDAEIAAAQRIVDGGFKKNLARDLGNRLGGGGGVVPGIGMGAVGGYIGSAFGPVGGAIGGGVGAVVPPTLGAAAKGIANRMTRKELEALDEALRKRSPLFLEREANPNMVAADPTRRAIMLRALLASEAGQ